MRKILMSGLFFTLSTMAFSSCSTTDPVITANPDRSNSTSGTAGSSPATDGPVPKPTDTLSTPRDTTIRQ